MAIVSPRIPNRRGTNTNKTLSPVILKRTPTLLPFRVSRLLRGQRRGGWQAHGDETEAPDGVLHRPAVRVRPHKGRPAERPAA